MPLPKLWFFLWVCHLPILNIFARHIVNGNILCNVRPIFCNQLLSSATQYVVPKMFAVTSFNFGSEVGSSSKGLKGQRNFVSGILVYLRALVRPKSPGLILKRSCFFFSVDLLCLSFSSSSKSRPKYVSKSTWFLNHLSSSSNCLWMCEKSWIRAFYGSIWSNYHFRYINKPEVIFEASFK